MADVGRLADEERVVLRDGGVVVARDEVGREARRHGGLLELPHRPRVRGRLRLGGVVQDGEIPAVLALPLAARAPREVRPRRLEDELAVRLGDVARGDRPHGAELPVPVTGVPREARPQERGREELVELAREALVPLGEVAPEVHAEVEALGLHGREALLDEVVERVGAHADDLAALEVFDGGHRRDGAMTAGLGEERDVVADALVAVGAAEVVDAPSPRAGRRAGAEVLPRAHDLHALGGEGEGLGRIDHQERDHGRGFGGPISSMPPAPVAPRPESPRADFRVSGGSARGCSGSRRR